MRHPHLHYFGQREFVRGGVDWYPHCSPRLLVLLDSLRHQWGLPVRISADAQAIGRNGGDSASWHNVDRHGVCYAIDIQPEGLADESDVYRFRLLAESMGFTGIGFYPHWRRPGFHLDVRPDRKPGQAATWGYVARGADRIQVSFDDALTEWV